MKFMPMNFHDRDLPVRQRRTLNLIACCGRSPGPKNVSPVQPLRRRALINDGTVLYRHFIRTICNSGLSKRERERERRDEEHVEENTCHFASTSEKRLASNTLLKQLSFSLSLSSPCSSLPRLKA